MEGSIMSLSPEALREAISAIKQQLVDIQRTVNAIGVQDERIKNVERQQEALWRKYDTSATVTDEMRRHQASCPRDQIRWVWWVLVPQSMVLVGLLFAILHRMGK